jgi:small subunit ribosomal protein S21
LKNLKIYLTVIKLTFFDELNTLYCFWIACNKRLQAHERFLVFMLKVKSRAGESVQSMLRRFKKLCEKEGLIRDMKRNAYYEKPSEKNRRRMRKAQRTISQGQ